MEETTTEAGAIGLQQTQGSEGKTPVGTVSPEPKTLTTDREKKDDENQGKSSTLSPETNPPSKEAQEAETSAPPETSPEEKKPDDVDHSIITNTSDSALKGELDPTTALEVIANIAQLRSFIDAIFELKKIAWLSQGGIEGIPRDILINLQKILNRQREKMLTGTLDWEEFASTIAEAGENNPKLKALALEIQKAALQDEINAITITSGKEPSPQDNEKLTQAKAKMQQVEGELKKLREQNSDLANQEQLPVLYKLITGKEFNPENPHLDEIPLTLARTAIDSEARQALIKRFETNLGENPDTNKFIESLESVLDKIKKSAPDIEKILTSLKRRERLKTGMGIILLLLIALGLITYKTAKAEESN